MLAFCQVNVLNEYDDDDDVRIVKYMYNNHHSPRLLGGAYACSLLSSSKKTISVHVSSVQLRRSVRALMFFATQCCCCCCCVLCVDTDDLLSDCRIVWCQWRGCWASAGNMSATCVRHSTNLFLSSTV